MTNVIPLHTGQEPLPSVKDMMLMCEEYLAYVAGTAERQPGLVRNAKIEFEGRERGICEFMEIMRSRMRFIEKKANERLAR